ncbi:MAG: hypothetical protein JRE70_14900 [Deltaproteobacteria bacterium]|nr:hypothetical protein [Deltaproteobacteria bacterium]
MTMPIISQHAGATDGGGTPRLRISRVLREMKEREGSYLKLEQAIRNAISGTQGSATGDDGSPRFVDRRKLKAIVENSSKLVLSIGELRALDQYLEPFGHSLAFNSMFEAPEVLRCVAEFGRVAFLLGSKTDEHDAFRVNISHWDLLGLNHIHHGVLGFSQNVRIDIREVRMQVNETLARSDLDDPELNQLFDDHGPSLVILGSSRGNQMAEWALTRMANEAPYVAAGPGGPANLPFHFVWPSGGYVLPSRFHLTGEEANREDPVAGDAVLNRNAACFRYSGGYLIDDLTLGKPEGYTYALCAAQRRERGQIWLLVAGLTGPATCAGAQWVNKFATGLYELQPGRRSGVFWNLVRARAVRVREGQHEAYRVGDAEVVGGGVDWAE